MMMTYLSSADEHQNFQEVTAPEDTEKANMVSMGIRRLQQLVQQSTEGYASEETGEKIEMAETPDSDSSAKRIR